MMQLAHEVKIHLSLAPVDMRKSIDGLCGLAETVFEEDPMSGHLFLFVSRDRRKLKCLYWNVNGYALWYKRLDRGRFSMPAVREGKCVLPPRFLAQLTGGLSLDRYWKNRCLM